MAGKQPYRIKTITEFHQLRGLPKPEHPLISIVNYGSIVHTPGKTTENWVQDFYSISLKRNAAVKIRYGRQAYDFDEGVLFFMAPNQIYSIAVSANTPTSHSGWILLVHPDFFWNSTLAKSIRHYEFFDYAVNEALFLSEKEEATILDIIENIRQEYHSNIDTFSQRIILSQIETLLSYSERFYQRQFITRKISSHQLLEKLEEWLSAYFDGDELTKNGLPSVQQIAGALNVSTGYLSSLLKVLTGQSTQQHIHEKLIEKAKEKLSTTHLSVSEIAYELGFEHPQSFSKLFKTKTSLSPLEFRASFN